MTELLVFKDFVLVDGTGQPPVPGARVLVEDGVIASVDSASHVPSGARVIEGRGRWLLPGLWDTHIHHSFSAGGFVWPEEFSEQQRLWNWRAYLRSGVTSVVSVGDDKDTILAARAAEREGGLVAPRIFASGSGFTAPGGHPVATILYGEPARFTGVAHEVDEPGDARRRLERLVADDDVDVVKVFYSTIPGNVPRLRRDVLDALVAEAHAHGRPLFAHVGNPDDAADCVAAGVDGLEHMVLGDVEAAESVFAAAAERGVFWTPTLTLFDKFAHSGDERYIDDYDPGGTVSRTILESLKDPASRWAKPDEASQPPPWGRTVEFAGRAHEAGVALVVGTDAGNPAVFHGLAVHRELELLVRAGLSPLEALTAASGRAATKVGVEARLGTVEPGKEADLVVVTGSPLEDIRNIRRAELVVKRGQLFDPAALAVP